MSEKVQLGAVPLIYPVPIVLVGALVEGQPNFETVGDVAIMGIHPALVIISSGADHHTNKGIHAHGTYSINVPTTEMLAQVDVCGSISGREVAKSPLFDVFFGELDTAPLIRQCPVNIECRVVEQLAVEHREMFVAEVVQTHIDAQYVSEEDGRRRIADLTQLDPIIYALDNRYYRIGAPIGVGYTVGQALKANLRV